MNIKTFGTVDERSLKQLERCMSAGDADSSASSSSGSPNRGPSAPES